MIKPCLSIQYREMYTYLIIKTKTSEKYKQKCVNFFCLFLLKIPVLFNLKKVSIEGVKSLKLQGKKMVKCISTRIKFRNIVLMSVQVKNFILCLSFFFLQNTLEFLLY